ncbi:hypothetical protein ACHAXA_004429 [Cyclostephanos tholiformis]|uniref:RNA polymerase-associated protein LEO1 n=1 Tax=Cyclostephanos tholiformis TaxID=382380 RepID=A0ABD3SBX2_9STRA
MTSKTNASAALFGEDSDDDDSVSSEDDPKTQPAVGDDDGAAADEGGGKEEETKGGEAKTIAGGGQEADTTTTSGKSERNNGTLFGDDDESSDDDEFDGNDDDIVGRSSSVGGGKKGIAARPTAEETGAGKSMNQRLGGVKHDDGGRAEPGDGDKEKDYGIATTMTTTKTEEPAYAPPRRMELMTLPGLHDHAGVATDDLPRPTRFITKLPNLVAINSAAYDASSHDIEREEGQYRGYVHNMIRWRYKTDKAGEIVRDGGGEPVRESNTRVVRWSDGSFTLHVGKEVLEVDNLGGGSVLSDHPDASVAGFPGINGYLYVSQKARIRPPSKKALERGGPPPEGEEDDDDDDDTPSQPAGTVLECIAPIASRLMPRPSSLASEAHRNLTLAVRQRNVKRARIAEIVTEVDPEKEKLARIKGKDDLEKSRARGGGGRRRSSGGGRRRGMNAGFLEDDDDYDGVNIGKLKRQTMRRDPGEEEMDYGDDDDSEEDDEGWMSTKKKTRGAAAARAAGAKAPPKTSKKYSESSDDGEVVFGDDDDDDDDDDDGAFVKKRGGGGGGAKKAVLSDDDDDD